MTASVQNLNGHAPVRRARLLTVDPDLAVGLAGDALAQATQALVVPALELPTGPCALPALVGEALAVLVAEGFLVHDERSVPVPDVRLAGPATLLDGRLLEPGREDGWTALSPVRLLVLRSGLVAAAARWPRLTFALTRRLFDGERERGESAAIRALPRVEDRIVRYLELASGRWGRVTAEGLRLDVPLTHELLGRLVGARRPTVTLALGQLAKDGLLIRVEDGGWLLPRARAA